MPSENRPPADTRESGLAIGKAIERLFVVALGIFRALGCFRFFHLFVEHFLLRLRAPRMDDKRRIPDDLDNRALTVNLL